MVCINKFSITNVKENDGDYCFSDDELKKVKKNSKMLIELCKKLERKGNVGGELNVELSDLRRICDNNINLRERADNLINHMQNHFAVSKKKFNMLDFLGVNVAESYRSISARLCKGVKELEQDGYIGTFYECDDDWRNR